LLQQAFMHFRVKKLPERCFCATKLNPVYRVANILLAARVIWGAMAAGLGRALTFLNFIFSINSNCLSETCAAPSRTFAAVFAVVLARRSRWLRRRMHVAQRHRCFPCGRRRWLHFATGLCYL
jgi:hypothetical protein